MFDSLQPHGLQHPRPPHPSPTPKACSNSVHQVCDATQSPHPLSSPSPPAFNLSQHQGLFQCVCSSHQVVKVLELQLKHQSFQWIFRTFRVIGGISLCPMVSQGSSSALQFESISFSVLSLLSGPTLTSTHDDWKNHSFDYMDLCLTAGRNKKEGEYSWCPHIHSYVAVTRTGDRLNFLRPLVVLLKEENEKGKEGDYP